MFHLILMFELFMDMYKTHIAVLSVYQLNTPVIAAILGLLASSFAAILTQPVDVIKTKLMVASPMLSDDEGSRLPHEKNFKKISPSLFHIKSYAQRTKFYQTYYRIVRTEGYLGLLSGLQSRLFVVGIGGIAYFFAAALVEKPI